MRVHGHTSLRATALLGAAGLVAAVAAALPAGVAAAVVPSTPALEASDMAGVPADATYRLSPQLAAMLGRPADTVLDAAGLQAVRTAASPRLPGQKTPPVGTTLLWPALDAVNGGPIGIYLKQYTLRGTGKKIEVWVASGTDDVSTGTAFPAGDCRNNVPGSTDITDQQVKNLVTEFDDNIQPKETKVFSTPQDRNGTATVPGVTALGVDFAGDGDHTVTLVDNVRDENFYEFPKNRSYIAGFYAPVINQLTDRNVMTIDAFDWLHRTGDNPKNEPSDDLCKSRPARPRSYEGVFAHEWQHLLHHYQDPNETTWVNEGLSDLAISLVGYADPRRNVTQTHAEGHLYCFQGYGLTKGPSNPNPNPCGGPQNSLTSWGDEGPGSEILADYGNAWSFMLFLQDRYGDAFISALHRDSRSQGLASVQDALDTFAKGTKVADVLHDYQLMNLVDRYVDVKGGTVKGISRDRVTTRQLDAAVNVDSPTAFDKPGAAANGADYVLLRQGGRALTGADLRSVSFTGDRTVLAAPAGADGGVTLPLGGGANRDAAAVQNWYVSLVGIDKNGHKALVSSRNGAFSASWSAEDLAAFKAYPTVVAVVAHDNPDDLDGAAERYAGYALMANGTRQGG
jgi:hypothetical protein